MAPAAERVVRRWRCAALALLLAWPAAGPAQSFGGPTLGRPCDDVAQRYRVAERHLNARTLDLLMLDAAAEGCLDLVRELLARGASISARDRFGNTALLRAAHGGETRVVRHLLEAGADLHRANLAGSTALLRAVDANRRRTAGVLLAAGADPGVANRKGVSPLAAAAFNGNARLVRMLLEAGAPPDLRDRTGKGPLTYAAGKGFADIVALLLDAGVAPDTRYDHQLTALMWAAGHSNDTPPAEGATTVSALLARGARHDLTDDRGRTPLMIAAARGHAQIVALLLAAGADPARRDTAGASASDLAANADVRASLARASVESR